MRMATMMMMMVMMMIHDDDGDDAHDDAPHIFVVLSMPSWHPSGLAKLVR